MGINSFPGNVKSNYQATAPTSPRVGDVWIDSSSDIASVDLIPSKITGHNLLHNGAMQIHQRGTSTASITATGYYTADRWQLGISALGTWTQSVENDAPSGSGFRKSLKMLCTTDDASPAASDLLFVTQSIEGQNLQSIKKGTADAQPLTLSFWVKSNKTGTYVVEILDADTGGLRHVSATYTVSSSGTWEQKTITFPADTTGVLDNDNAASLQLSFWLASGSTYTSGTLPTSWAAYTAANRAVGQTNLASAINNYIQITGVQLEAGSVQTPYDHKDYGQELSECQRYYQLLGAGDGYILGTGYYHSSTEIYLTIPLKVTMRTTPTNASTTTTNSFLMTPSGDWFDSMSVSTGSTPDTVLFYTTTQVSGTTGYAGLINTRQSTTKVAVTADL